MAVGVVDMAGRAVRAWWVSQVDVAGSPAARAVPKTGLPAWPVAVLRLGGLHIAPTGHSGTRDALTAALFS